MEQNLDNYEFSLKDEYVKILKKNTDKSHKCNQCDFAYSRTGHSRRYLKTHSREKSNKCNQCDNASSQAADFRKHLKMHSGENQTNAINVTLPALIPAR